MPPKSVENKRVLITGAASGIGRATAVASARKGARLYLTDINEAPLAAVAAEIRAAGGDVDHAEALDISDHAAVAAMADEIHSAHGSVDIVIVSSAAGIFGLPWHAPYSAAKFGLRGVSEVLRFDLHAHDIGVSLVCPGAVDTGLVNTIEIAGVDSSSPTIERFTARFRRS